MDNINLTLGLGNTTVNVERDSGKATLFLSTNECDSASFIINDTRVELIIKVLQQYQKMRAL